MDQSCRTVSHTWTGCNHVTILGQKSRPPILNMKKQIKYHLFPSPLLLVRLLLWSVHGCLCLPTLRKRCTWCCTVLQHRPPCLQSSALRWMHKECDTFGISPPWCIMQWKTHKEDNCMHRKWKDSTGWLKIRWGNQHHKSRARFK